MAGFLALAVSDTYIGTYKSTQEVENGSFVEFNHQNKTGTLAQAGATDVYFVVNEIDDVDEEGIDTIDFRVKEGEYLRAHKPQSGEILVTTVFDGDLVEGDTVGITGDGKVGKVESEALFVVKELTGEYGVPTVRLLVL